ncbi:stealth family protein [Cellulosimicrobium terreum]|nr:stealth family protein [Cellulosimicrobium terreum]
MSVRTAVAAHMSIGARLRVSRLAHGQLAWQRSLVRSVRRARSGRVPDGLLLVGPVTGRLLARVVESFDSWAVRDDTLRTVRAALDARGVPYALLDVRPARLVVPEPHAVALRDALADVAAPEWCVQVAGDRRVLRLDRWLAGDGRAEAVSLCRALASPEGTLLGGEAEAVEVELWSVVDEEERPRPDGGVHVPGTLVPPRYNGTTSYVTPRAWAAAQRRDDRRLVTASRLQEVIEPIDLVYTWVDGTDPSWQAERERAEAGLPAGAVNPNALSSSRFLGHDELRYSLRSVEMYASWVRHVHVVTCGQVPSWLDTTNPRISVVDHREIFSDTTGLPVFNSHAIESQLHHLPGLSERYLYLNDDVFFGRPVAPELFFEGNGLSRFFVSRALLDLDPPSVRDLPVLSAAKHNRELIENLSGRTVTNKVKHTPHPQQRKVLEELEDAYPELFKHLVGSRFRDPADHSVASALHHWYAYVTGRAVEGQIAYDYLDLASEEAVLTLNRISRARDFDVFCLNDTNLEPGEREGPSRMMQDMLRAYFPLRSSFERPGAAVGNGRT